MRIDQKPGLAKFNTLALAIMAVMLPMQGAIAQDNTSADGAQEDVERINVVGSRRAGRTVSDSPVPIDIIDEDSIKATGLTETNMILNTLLPSFNFPQPSITDGTDHVRPAQLRGLAPDHTLVLVNGKRRHTSALLNLNGSMGRGSSAVDLNTIPANAIKRIEVLRDGAAAQYGSDAIAGVINIVLKDSPEGGEVSVTYGANVTTMDGVPNLDSVSIDNGSLSLQTGSDREVTDGQTLTLRGNMGFELGTDGFIHVAAEYRDRGEANRADYDPRQNYPLVNGELDPREVTFDRYNHVFGNGAVTDFSVFANAGKYLTDSAELYVTASAGNRNSVGAGFYRRASDSRNVLSIYPDGFLPRIKTDIKDMSLIAGVRGYQGDWNYDVSVTHGQNDLDYSVINTLNVSLGPSSQTQFDAGGLEYGQTVFNVDASRFVDTDLFYSEVNVAVGAEYRRETYDITAGEPNSYIQGTFGPGGAVTDPVDGPFGAAGSQVFPGFTPESAGSNSRHNYSFYVDLDTNITEDWNAAVAVRFEDYSDFGSTVNWKMSHRYELNQEWALRGSISTGFRAPSLQQQNFTSIATVFVDSVPTETGTFAPSSDVALALGSPGLDAEESTNFSAGITYSPSANFNLSVDFYRIDIDDRIVLSNNLSGPAIETLLAGTGAVSGRFFLNAIDSRTQGVDVVTTYTYDTDSYGTLLFNAGVNINDNEVTDIIAPPAVLQGAGFDQDNLFSDVELRRFETGTPSDKINLGVTWNYDIYNATLRTTRYGEVEDPSSIAARNEIIPSEWVTDLDVNIAVTDNINVAVGANNIFDVYPRATRYNIEDVTTFANIFPYSGFSAFGFTGRYLYGKVSYRF